MNEIASSRTYFDTRKAANCAPGNHLCGSICVSRKKKCRSPRLGNPTEAAFSKGRKALEAANEKIRNLPRERAIAIDPATGRSLFVADGDEVSVVIPEKYRSRLKGSYLTHNHPSMFKEDPGDPRNKGYGFSPADFVLAATEEVAEIHAISAGFNHTLGPPKDGWNKQWLEKKAAPVFNKHYKNVYRESVHRIIFGRLDARIADRDLWHHVMERTAKELGMKYSRTEARGDSRPGGIQPDLLLDLSEIGLSPAYLDAFSIIRSDKKCGSGYIPDNKTCRKSGGVESPPSKVKAEESPSKPTPEEIAKQKRRKRLGNAIAAGILGLHAYNVYRTVKATNNTGSTYSAREKGSPQKPSKPWHDILGVNKNATPDEIKKAYKKKASQYHPDINKEKGAEQKMKDVNAAYEWVQYNQKFGKFKKDSLGLVDLLQAYREAQRWHPKVPTQFWVS